MEIYESCGVLLLYLQFILLPLLPFSKTLFTGFQGPFSSYTPPIYFRPVIPLCLQGFIFDPLLRGGGYSPQLLQLALKLCSKPFQNNTWHWLKTAQLSPQTSAVRAWRAAPSSQRLLQPQLSQSSQPKSSCPREISPEGEAWVHLYFSGAFQQVLPNTSSRVCLVPLFQLFYPPRPCFLDHRGICYLVYRVGRWSFQNTVLAQVVTDQQLKR